jgi:hypothetical protein
MREGADWACCDGGGDEEDGDNDGLGKAACLREE